MYSIDIHPTFTPNRTWCMQILSAAQRSCTKLVFLYLKFCTLNRNFPINSTTHIWIRLNVMTKYHRPPSTTILNISVVNSNFRVPLIEYGLTPFLSTLPKMVCLTASSSLYKSESSFFMLISSKKSYPLPVKSDKFGTTCVSFYLRASVLVPKSLSWQSIGRDIVSARMLIEREVPRNSLITLRPWTCGQQLFFYWSESQVRKRDVVYSYHSCVSTYYLP